MWDFIFLPEDFYGTFYRFYESFTRLLFFKIKFKPKIKM